MSTGDVLYHGSLSDLRVGDHIECRRAGLAYATPHLYTARVFARLNRQVEKQGRVYLVEPIEPGEPWTQDMPHTNGEPHIEVVSTVGYRVVGLAGDLPVNPSEECFVCVVVGDDGDHDCTDHQIVGFHLIGHEPATEPCSGPDECEDCQSVLAESGEDWEGWQAAC